MKSLLLLLDPATCSSATVALEGSMVYDQMRLELMK